MSVLLSRVLQTAKSRSILLKFMPFSATSQLRGTSFYNPPIGIEQEPQSNALPVILPEVSKNPLVKFPDSSPNCVALQQKRWLLLLNYQQATLNKHLPSNLHNKVFDIYQKQQPVDIEEETKQVYFMGSLLKKRRRKMNRQKYKKRRKRDRFKRAALKNLREKKRLRKERAFNRKQSMLSKMVVNKSISKRLARYLSHKVLPGVMKGQNKT